MDYDWKVKLQWEIGMIGFALYVYRQNHDGTRDFVTKDGIKTIKEMSTKESLWLHVFESTDQLRQLIEESEKQGVQAPSTASALGELKATKYHLEDLRKIIPRLSQPPTNQLEEEK